MEIVKPRLNDEEKDEPRREVGMQAQAQAVLYKVLSTSLKLLHPFMPFITEEMWQDLHNDSTSEHGANKMLIGEEWPEAQKSQKTQNHKIIK